MSFSIAFEKISLECFAIRALFAVITFFPFSIASKIIVLAIVSPPISSTIVSISSSSIIFL